MSLLPEKGSVRKRCLNGEGTGGRAEEARGSVMACPTEAGRPGGTKEPRGARVAVGRVGMVAEETIKEVGRGLIVQSSVHGGRIWDFMLRAIGEAALKFKNWRGKACFHFRKPICLPCRDWIRGAAMTAFVST